PPPAPPPARSPRRSPTARASTSWNRTTAPTTTTPERRLRARDGRSGQDVGEGAGVERRLAKRGDRRAAHHLRQRDQQVVVGAAAGGGGVSLPGGRVGDVLARLS